jgi:hypothetical protein
MAKDVEQDQAWGGGITRPVWTDVQGWHEGNVSMTKVPGDALGSMQAQAGLPWPRGQVAEHS